MLDRLGWFWQALTARAIERDEEEIAAWCTQVWPGTKRER